MKRIKLRVPATTANFGSGFDVFGAALKLYNEIEITSTGDKRHAISFEITGEGSETLPRNENNVVYKSMKKVFDALHFTPYTLHIRLINRIPLARGLGSSAAARLGGLVAANKLCGSRIPDAKIIRMVTELEGHPDNVIPSFVGGLCVCSYNDGDVKFTKINMPSDLKAVVCIPEFEVSTDGARKILPDKVSRRDAVFNLGRAALFVTAVVTKKYDLLDTAMEDKLHQPYRKKLIPGLDDVFKAARAAGALGVCISGSGPSILAVTRAGNANAAGERMQKVFFAHKIKSRFVACDFDNRGLHD
jgi:homoserine kinase